MRTNIITLLTIVVLSLGVATMAWLVISIVIDNDDTYCIAEISYEQFKSELMDGKVAKVVVNDFGDIDIYTSATSSFYYEVKDVEFKELLEDISFYDEGVLFKSNHTFRNILICLGIIGVAIFLMLLFEKVYLPKEEKKKLHDSLKKTINRMQLAYYFAGKIMLTYKIQDNRLEEPSPNEIIKRGVKLLNKKLRTIHSKADVSKQIAILLAGRVAEEIGTGKISNISYMLGDLQEATDAAEYMVEAFCLEATSRVWKEASNILHNEGRKTKNLLMCNKRLLDEIAEELLKGGELEKLI